MLGPEHSFLGTLALVFLAIAIVFSFDTFMAKLERTEDQAEARRLFADGQRLQAQGRNQLAIERFRSALSISRGNRDYTLALGQTLLAAGQAAEAEAAIDELLGQDSTDGSANLLKAQIQVKQGDIAKATPSYHRAIYGQWRDDPAQHQMTARMELVDLLARQDMPKELLAELLPLQDQIGDDVAAQMRLARLYLLANSPPRAADLFRDVIRKSPESADAYAGLAEAEFARGDYPQALRNFQAALRLRPDDDALRKKRNLSNEVLALDPTRRGLNSQERYRRSLEVLSLANQSLASCAGSAPPKEISNVLDQANKALKRRVRAAEQSDDVDSNLDLAQTMWRLRKQQCAQAPGAAEEPLALVLAKTGQ
jgi:tetratricopeptide (TPR) repeat protein